MTTDSEAPGDERKEIASKYTKQKEKVIGKTLKIRSDFHAAFNSFSESIKNNWCQCFLITNKSIVHRIYTQWEGENLRALQRTLWDFERVVAVLTEDIKNNTKGMEFLLKWFLAFSLEIRDGSIRPLEFFDSDLALANKKYSGFGLTTPVLSDFSVMQIILEGLVDRDLINKEIIGSLPFRKEVDREPWIQLLDPWSFSSEELEGFSKELESKFQSRGYVDPITIIHVCMLRIWLAEIGRSGESKDNILSETKEYINKLDEDGKLPVPSAKVPWTEAVFRSPQIQYAKSDDDLTEIIDYFLHTMRRQLGKKLEDWSEEILTLLKTDIITFYKRTCVPTFESSFVHVPVFSKIQPTVFVDCLLSVPSENQKMALEALRERYRSTNNNLNLKPEFLWIADVEVELKSRKDHLIYFDKSRVDFFIDHFLKPIKEEIDKFTKY